MSFPHTTLLSLLTPILPLTAGGAPKEEVRGRSGGKGRDEE